MRQKRVFMVLPYLGQVEDKSRRAAYLYPTRRFHVLHRPVQASLLAYGLNLKWAEMENGESEDGAVQAEMKHCPGAYDYLAILHADCSPDYWWLDALADEAEEHKLDCIHAVTAIKSDEGLTSTGFSSVQHGVPIRKLSLKEVHEKLPRTFTIEDVERKVSSDRFNLANVPLALLPNTGVFLLRVSDGQSYFPWVREFPGFTITDWFDRGGIGFCKTRARVVSEDWNFGRWAAGQGLKVGGTRAVVVRHIGTAEYSNEYPPRKSLDRDEGFFRQIEEVRSR